MSKTRRIYYYSVEAQKYNTSGQPSNTVIDPILNLTRGKRLVPTQANTSSLSIGNKTISVRVLGPVNHIYTGEVYTINDARAFKSVLDDGGIDKIADLGVPLGHHIVDIAHFVYFSDRNVIGIEYNHRAARHRYFAQYLREVAHKNTIAVDEVGFNLLLNTDSVKRLENLGVITSINFSVHSTQTQNMAAASRLTQLARAQSELLQGDYDLTVRLQRSSKARGTSIPVTKGDVAELWLDAAEILEGLTVEAERPGRSGIERVNFLNDAFIATFEERKGESSGDLHARMVDYFRTSVEGVIWPR